MADQVDPSILLRIAVGLERIAEALEIHNQAVKKSNQCPSCLGDGKGYGIPRCIPCGGTGVRQR